MRLKRLIPPYSTDVGLIFRSAKAVREWSNDASDAICIYMSLPPYPPPTPIFRPLCMNKSGTVSADAPDSLRILVLFRDHCGSFVIIDGILPLTIPNWVLTIVLGAENQCGTEQ